MIGPILWHTGHMPDAISSCYWATIPPGSTSLLSAAEAAARLAKFLRANRDQLLKLSLRRGDNKKRLSRGDRLESRSDSWRTQTAEILRVPGFHLSACFRQCIATARDRRRDPNVEGGSCGTATPGARAQHQRGLLCNRLGTAGPQSRQGPQINFRRPILPVLGLPVEPDSGLGLFVTNVARRAETR